MQTQEEFIKVQNKGLITIPKSFRDDLGIRVNSIAKIKKVKGRIILEPVRILPYPVRSYKNSEIKEFIDLDNKESKQLKKEGLL